MSVLYVLLPLALLGATGWAVTFVWSVHRGQLEDLEGAAWRPLGNDERKVQ
jgi:cbb3-type cytochrome oxidase maturation protein